MPADPTPAVADVLERLRKATGPDAELDLAIELALGLWSPPAGTYRDTEYPNRWRYERGGYTTHRAPRFSASLDAALALTERVLPGCAYGLSSAWEASWGSEPAYANVRDANTLKVSGGKAPTPALALLIATLSALEAQQ